MMMSNQRARGLGHRAFYLHPEPVMGSGVTPDGHRTSQPPATGEPVPDTPTTETGTKAEGDTGSTSTSTTK